MQSAKFAGLCLFVLAVGLAAGNHWTATHRSTIPLSLNGTVTKTEQRFEKHHGKDDVYLIWIDDVEYQVDRELFGEIAEGDTVSKSAWSQQALVSGRSVTLGYSKDWSGMRYAMPLVVCAFGATIVFSLRLAATRDGADSDPTLGSTAADAHADVTTDIRSQTQLTGWLDIECVPLNLSPPWQFSESKRDECST